MTEIIVVIMAYGKQTMITCTNPYKPGTSWKKIIKGKKREDKNTAIINAMLWFLSTIPKKLKNPVRTRIVMPLPTINSISPIIRQLIYRAMVQNNHNIIIQSYTSLDPRCRAHKIGREMISYMWSVLNK